MQAGENAYCAAHQTVCRDRAEGIANSFLFWFYLADLLPSGGEDEEELQQTAEKLEADVAATQEVETEALASLRLIYDDHIVRDLDQRGWTVDGIESVVGNPVEKHPVWDLTSVTPQPATAYAVSNNTYVVVNDMTGKILQISDRNNEEWKPVWLDPRFARE